MRFVSAFLKTLILYNITEKYEKQYHYKWIYILYFFILLIPSLLIKVIVLLIYTFMIEHYFDKFKFNILLIELIYLIVNYSFKTIGINENIYEITLLFNFEIFRDTIIGTTTFIIVKAFDYFERNLQMNKTKKEQMIYLMIHLISLLVLIAIYSMIVSNYNYKNWIYCMFICIIVLLGNIVFSRFYNSNIEKQHIINQLQTNERIMKQKLIDYEYIKKNNDDLFNILHDIKAYINHLSPNDKIDLQNLINDMKFDKIHFCDDELVNLYLLEQQSFYSKYQQEIDIEISSISFNFIDHINLLLMIQSLLKLCSFSLELNRYRFKIYNIENMIIFSISGPLLSNNIINQYQMETSYIQSIIEPFNGSFQIINDECTNVIIILNMNSTIEAIETVE